MLVSQRVNSNNFPPLLFICKGLLSVIFSQSIYSRLLYLSQLLDLYFPWSSYRFSSMSQVMFCSLMTRLLIHKLVSVSIRWYCCFMFSRYFLVFSNEYNVLILEFHLHFSFLNYIPCLSSFST